MPMRIFWRRTAAVRSPSRSRFGPTSMLFHGRAQVRLASWLGQSGKPSWCLEVSTTYLAPDWRKVAAHWSGSKSSARNIGAKPS